jgi:hypothetical protein
MTKYTTNDKTESSWNDINRTQKEIVLVLAKNPGVPMTVIEITEQIISLGLEQMSDEELDKYRQEIIAWNNSL